MKAKYEEEGGPQGGRTVAVTSCARGSSECGLSSPKLAPTTPVMASSVR